MQLQQNNFKIGIIGLGLIGGSIYKCLVANGFKNIFACSSNVNTIEAIKAEGYLASADINVLKDCDVIFVGSPISQTAKIISDVFQINKNAVYVDVASLKFGILNEVSKLDGCKFIGSHPMAGTENSGFSASFAELFQGAKWVITPSSNVSSDYVDMLAEFVVSCGAIPVFMDAKLHDEVVSMISHTPMLLAQALMHSVQNDDDAKLLAASGFRDMTRLAMSNKFMAADMLKFNKANIQRSLQLIINNAQRLLDDDYFEQNIDAIISDRQSLYDEAGKNRFKNNC